MDDKLKKRILNRKKDGTLRQLNHNNISVDFFSNDYLGMAKEDFSQNTSSRGSTGSRLLSGNSKAAINCESKLASFFDSENTLVFNSGYDANLGLLSCVPQRGDYILYDELIHASIRDGIRLSFAKSSSFKHNDCDDLKKQLRALKGTVYIVVESLYSMDGDMATLKSIGILSQEFGAYLIVDEAHACGVFGSDGKGIVHGRSMQGLVFCRIVTFGKAYGYHGAGILCSNELKEYLVNYSRSFIYTTALPPEAYASIIERVESTSIRKRQVMLHNNIAYLRDNVQNCDFISEENSPIQVLVFDNKEKLFNLIDKLSKAGIYTKPILPPTVPLNSFRIRLCIHSYNSIEEIKLLISCLD